jgi:hypothetical protein
MMYFSSSLSKTGIGVGGTSTIKLAFLMEIWYLLATSSIDLNFLKLMVDIFEVGKQIYSKRLLYSKKALLLSLVYLSNTS